MAAVAMPVGQGLAARYQEEIDGLVYRGLIDEALKRLQDCVRDLAPALKRDTMLLCARHNEQKSARRKGIITTVETDPAIVSAIVELAEQVSAMGAIQPHLQVGLNLGSAIVSEPKPISPLSSGSQVMTLIEDQPEQPSPDLSTADANVAPTPSAVTRHFPVESATVHPFPIKDPPEQIMASGAETLDEFRKEHWRRFGAMAPPEKSIACIADGVTRGYRGSPFRLAPLSFKLRAGEITGVVGRNAAGKTTLLRMVLGELQPHEGRLSYPMLTTEGSSWRHIKSQIAYVPQLPPRWPGRLRENLNFAASLAGVKGRANKELVEWNMQRYGLAGYADYRWDEISGGYKIRFELAKALVSKPRLLVLDEPLAHLDVMGRQEFLSNLAAVAASFEQPVPIIITSQHLYEIEAIADQMIILDGGASIYVGPIGGIESVVPHRKLELSVRTTAKAIAAALKPHGLIGIEQTMDGFIVSFPKEASLVGLFELMARTFGAKLTAVRDITGSARSLFKEELDHLPPMDELGGRIS